jgi:ADP-sugar diphosphatase
LQCTETSASEDLAQAMYPSPGACDESMPIFMCEKRLPRAEIDALRGRLTGLRDEGEKIKLKLVKLQDLWKACSRDGKALAAVTLYNSLKSENKI